MTIETTQSNNESFMIVVETWRNNGGRRESVRTIDYNNREERVWLARHCFWAFRNGRTVVTHSADDVFSFTCD